MTHRFSRWWLVPVCATTQYESAICIIFPPITLMSDDRHWIFYGFWGGDLETLPNLKSILSQLLSKNIDADKQREHRLLGRTRPSAIHSDKHNGEPTLEEHSCSTERLNFGARSALFDGWFYRQSQSNKSVSLPVLVADDAVTVLVEVVDKIHQLV